MCHHEIGARVGTHRKILAPLELNSEVDSTLHQRESTVL